MTFQRHQHSHRRFAAGTCSRDPIAKWVAAVCLVLFCLPSAVQAQPQDDSKEPSAAEIQRWVAALDNDAFAVRVQAQLQLEEAGRLALPAVAAAARRGSLESTTRALNVLLAWSESQETDFRILALQQIAALPNRKTAASMAAGLLSDVREQSALETIATLGGRFAQDSLIRVAIPISGRHKPPLKVIIGPEWKGGADGLKHLADLKRITTISFHSAPIKDKALAVLSKVPHLRRVEIYGTNISKDAITQLRKTLSENVTIEVRSGAMLGVIAMSPNGPAQIDRILPGSAAAKGGLRRGDIVTEIDGKEVANFTILTQRIAEYQPGDTISLKVMRGGKTIEIKVTFDRWGQHKLGQAGGKGVQINAHPFLPKKPGAR